MGGREGGSDLKRYPLLNGRYQRISSAMEWYWFYAMIAIDVYSINLSIFRA